MKILVISDRYPPFYTGGYELGCHDAVEALRERGHEVHVLTSTFGVGAPADNGHVSRWLEASFDKRRMGLLELLRKETINKRAFRYMINTFRPDVVYIWKLNRISVSLAFLAQDFDLPVAYYVFDRWITNWRTDPWYDVWNRRAKRKPVHVIKQMLRPVLSATSLVWTNTLDFSHAQLCSHYIKNYALETGTPVEQAEVIHWGVDPERFPYQNGHYQPHRLLFVGRLVPHKGVHTTINALKLLVQQPRYAHLHLTIVGDSDYSEYLANIRFAIRQANLSDHVTFVKFTDRNDLPAIYRAHDILLFPSVWEEPFGITVLEAMSSGLAVIGTGTGGGSEILEHDVNGLVYPKEDAAACAGCIARLVDDPDTYERLRQNGRASVEHHFDLDAVIDKIEQALHKAVAQ
ncbi:MAG: glycosyltransferase family 4 protein [Chloroflexi bacterium]|nr:glycosyltransferase family 4 protein [Chloroflexota bacterium]